MKKRLISVFAAVIILSFSGQVSAQQFKIAVFDLDLMVQAMPGYRAVDSLVDIYEKDSLSAEFEYYQWEYQRLDSTYKADSLLVAEGKKQKIHLDMIAADRQKMAINIVYWQQIGQNKSENKRGQLAQPLYNQVAGAYQKVLARKKYNLILKPNTFELGFPVDNLFISVAKELKLTGLPQELLYAGDDPDAVQQPPVKQPATKQPVTPVKPKN
jgi:Skp family chaperone for outer membrane proteins